MKRKKRSVNEKAADWMSQVIRWLAFICLALVFVLNLFYTSSVGDGEKVTIAGSSWQWIPMAVVLAAVLIFWNGLSDRISEKKLFAGMAVFYIIVGFYFIFNINPTIRDDAKSVYDTAAAMADGDYSSLNPGGYLYVYPYQIGIVTYDRIVRLFSGSMKFLEVLNLAQVLGINWFSYRLSDHFFGGNRKINNLTILLTFAFLPQFFFIMFKYGLIPGFFFSIGSFYFLTIYLKNNRLRYVVLSVVFATAASCIKMNYLIGAIAAAARMHTFFWIVMGTDIDNEVRGPGWYNSIGWKVMGDHDYNVEESNEEARRLLEENLQKIQDNPGKATTFFGRKTISLWCDPIYQSLWSGLSQYELDNGSVEKEVLEDLYSNGVSEQISAVIVKALLLLITAGAVIYLLFHWKQQPILLYAPLYFLGGFLFHSFWEAKSQYVYTYIFLLIPLCAFEMHLLAEWVNRLLEVRRKQRRRRAGKSVRK